MKRTRAPQRSAPLKRRQITKHRPRQQPGRTEHPEPKTYGDWRDVPKERTCSYCAETFMARPPWRKTCSLTCEQSAKEAGRKRGVEALAQIPRERKVLLKKCARCSASFEARPSQFAIRKYCSRRCANEVKRLELPAARQGKANPNYRHGKRAGVRVRAEEPKFIDPVGRCRHPACTGGGWDLCQHHVIYRQEIRRRNGPQLDGRDALSLCRSCHTSHHRGGAYVVPLSVLRDENYEFARELMGPGAAYEYLRRHYKGDDPRLDALLAEWRVESERAA